MDVGPERLGMHDYGFEVFDTDADMELFLDREVFEIQSVYGNRSL